jgi:hypothetical protein
MAAASLVVSIVAAFAAIVATVIALASARYTRQQAKAADKANAIEAKRLHTELTPKLAISIILPESEFIGAATLEINLIGPAGLDRLDTVTTCIREDRIEHIPGRESKKIYGPYIFLSGSRSAKPIREYGPFSLVKNEPYRTILQISALEATRPFRGRIDWRNRPVRVELTCLRDGYEPWKILTEVMAVRTDEE